MRLAESSWLALLPLALLPWLVALRRRRLGWPALTQFPEPTARWVRWARSWPWVVRGGAILGLVVILARPQTVGGTVRVAGRGVTLMAVLDRSSSMNTVDFPTKTGPVSRLAAARSTLKSFLAGRSDDLVGLVAFARFPDTMAAPTLDQGFVLDALDAIRPASALDDGTNLGDAITWSLGAIRDSPTRRRVLLLLSDGRDAPAVPNPVPPLVAAKLARDLGVVIHTVAVGKPGSVPTDPDGGETSGPDLALLERIATEGGGRSFAAADAEALAEVLRVVDALEVSPVAATVHTLYREQFAPWAGLALACLVLDFLLEGSRWRIFP